MNAGLSLIGLGNMSVSLQEAGLLPLPPGKVRAGRAMGGIESWGEGIRGLVGEGYLRGHGATENFE